MGGGKRLAHDADLKGMVDIHQGVHRSPDSASKYRVRGLIGMNDYRHHPF